METRRVEKNDTAGRAAAYYVRIRAMNADEYDIPVDVEINDTEDSEYIVTFDGVHPVGTCRLHIVDGDTAKIERVVTLRSVRKTGVGRLTITAAEDWLREKGIKKVIIESRDVAVGFYEKLGYKPDFGKYENKEGALFQLVYTEKNL